MTSSEDSMNILLVGNNPRELTVIYSSISAFTSPVFKLEVAFDLRNIFQRIRKFKPATILIDDRLNHRKLNRLIKRIHRNAHTHDIPVTILKSSNDEFAIDAEVDDYILKANLGAERLRFSILNSIRLRKTSIFLYKSYRKSRNIFQKVWLEWGHRY